MPVLVAARTAVVGALFLLDDTTCRVVYSSPASYHAYLELPVSSPSSLGGPDMSMLLADAAPTGAGLAIVGIILLAFLAIAVATIVFVVVKVRRFIRRNRPVPEGGVSAGS